MAVYTPVEKSALEAFLAQFDVGRLVSFKGIAEGIENSNYLVQTDRHLLILTLFEKRVAPEDIPYFLSLCLHLAKRGIKVAAPCQRRSGEHQARLHDREAVLVTFLPGASETKPQEQHCAKVGEALGALHRATGDFQLRRANPLDLDGWHSLIGTMGDDVETWRQGVGEEIRDEWETLAAIWPRSLPRGTVHSDLFPDNVLFLDGEVSGLIDFYFSCDDALAYDLAVCLVSWCFARDVWQSEKAMHMIAGYERQRPLTRAENEVLKVLARGAAFRFFLTRLHDWLYHPPDSLVRPHDPGLFLERNRKLRADDLAFVETSLAPNRAKSDPSQAPGKRKASKQDGPIAVYTDGSCLGNPGPGGWAVLIQDGDQETVLKGGAARATNNVMEMTAALRALSFLPKSSRVRVMTDSRLVVEGMTRWIGAWQKRGWRTASNKPVANMDLWKALVAQAERHEVDWVWVKGHALVEGNERVDALARKEAKAIQERSR